MGNAASHSPQDFKCTKSGGGDYDDESFLAGLELANMAWVFRMASPMAGVQCFTFLAKLDAEVREIARHYGWIASTCKDGGPADDGYVRLHFTPALLTAHTN